MSIFLQPNPQSTCSPLGICGLTTQSHQGLVNMPQRILLVAPMLSTGTGTANVPSDGQLVQRHPGQRARLHRRGYGQQRWASPTRWRPGSCRG